MAKFKTRHANHRFLSKQDAMGRAIKVWVCRQCDLWHEKVKPTLCKRCHCENFHYMASKDEARRYAQLQLLVKAGVIKNLRMQVPFRFRVNFKDIFTYRADFTYDDQDGKWIVEDVKPAGFSSDVFKIKKKCIEAMYGLEIREVYIA